MAFQGNLHDIALPDILQLLAAQSKSGVLSLTRDGETVQIDIVDGAVVMADTNPRPISKRLGTMLVKAGKLTRVDLEKALAVQKESGGMLGAILLQRQFVAEDDVTRALSIQFRQIIYGVLAWDDASYDFVGSDVECREEIVSPISVQSLLMDGFRMIDEWPQLKKRLARRQTVLHQAKPPEEAPETESTSSAEEDSPLGFGDVNPPEPEPPSAGSGLDLSPIEEEVYQRVDGVATIQQIIDRCLQLEFDVCRALFDLMKRDLVCAAYDGDLGAITFPELILAIRRTGSSGELELSQGGVTKRVWFRNGDFVGASSSNLDDGIGPHLLVRDVIKRREYVAAMAGGGVDRFIESLTEIVALDPERLRDERAEQMTNIILSLFDWTGGSYRYRPGLPASLEALGLEDRTSAMLLRGVRSIERWSRVEAAVGELDQSYRLSDTTSEWWSILADEQRKYLECFETGRTIGDVSQRGDLGDFAGHQLIWWAELFGVIERDGMRKPIESLVAALNGQADGEAVVSDDYAYLDELMPEASMEPEPEPEPEPAAPTVAASAPPPASLEPSSPSAAVSGVDLSDPFGLGQAPGAIPGGDAASSGQEPSAPSGNFFSLVGEESVGLDELDLAPDDDQDSAAPAAEREPALAGAPADG